jgi:hypothetical protein
MASAISSRRSTLNEKRLREIVLQTSWTALVSNIFDEVRVFLNCLDDPDARFRFLSDVPCNILDKADAVHVCEVFNGLEPGSLEHFGEDSSDIFHPFRDLYIAGMLGVIDYDPELGITVQRFRRPHDPLSRAAAELPDSPVYLLHPALDIFIRSQHTRTPFLQYQHVPVGENLLWEPHFPVLMQIEKHLRHVDDQEFVDMAHQLVKRMQSLLNTGTTRFARIEIETCSDWLELQRRPRNEAGDDALLWMEELLGRL